MKKFLGCCLATTTILSLVACTTIQKEDPNSSSSQQSAHVTKARTVITTDGEVDDMNSMIRYFYYANEMDLAGIVLTSSTYHYAGDKDKRIEPFRWTGTDWIYDMIDAYEEIQPNLAKHAEGYPQAEAIRQITKIGNIKNVGEMDEETEGSEFLKDLFLDDDNRPLYVQTWGGTNTTARALKSIEEEYKDKSNWKEIQQKVYDKLVVYIILDQDDSYKNYIQKSWPKLTVINDSSNFWHFAYAWKFHSDEVNTYLQGDWNYENIQQNHGPLLEKYALMGDGKILDGELAEEQRGSEDYLKNNPQYSKYDFISEGDSPSYFYLFQNGLQDITHPEYGGWGGRFGQVSEQLYQNTVLDYNPYAKRFEAEYSLMRWFDDIQRDFAARADWGIADNYEDANHVPTANVKEGLSLSAKAGESVTLTGVGEDPDGDKLTYRWWRYFEADTYQEYHGKSEPISDNSLGLQISLYRELDKDEVVDPIELEGADSETVSFTVPKDAKSGDTLHLILEVQDNGNHNLKAYQRVIVTIK
ncbi:nucleoside hydrolase-like domain-containing protein [Streptococcus caprae]|uniref:Nucleoside hydrolase-like domain-containing protein n=1 Tax=Streptococcus caprae TaxID=1640501 RepID=A0ABV8CV08_9STRE